MKATLVGLINAQLGPVVTVTLNTHVLHVVMNMVLTHICVAEEG